MPVDESQIKVKDLARILPDEVLAEMAKNLVGDIMQAAPPMFWNGGEDLYTHGNVVFYTDNNSFYAQMTVPVESGRETVNLIVGWGLSKEAEETLEELGLEKDKMIEQIGLFILSNVNGESSLHEYAVNLFDEIGTDAFSGGQGEVDTGELIAYVEEEIGEIIGRTPDIKGKFYWQGVLKHTQALLNSGKVPNVKSAIEVFNEAIKNSQNEITYYNDADRDFDEQVVEDVFNYLVNPISFFKANPDMIINLTAYEQQYGKSQRQPELPGIEQDTGK
jgi:hypothetical protein